MSSVKKYGLIIPSSKKKLQAKKIAVNRASVFGDDSSGDEDAHKEVNAQIHKASLKKIMQKQTQNEIQKALEQDSTVYEYDSIYDDIKEKNKKIIPAHVSKADKARKPKYISNLLKTAEKRVKERERREERKIQKERENEGDEFEDKEEFVTSAYKLKMQERQKEIEEEKRMDAIEEALDVRKQKDLSGFYRNFLNRQMGEQKEERTSDEKNEKAKSNTEEQNEDEDTDLSFSSDEEESEEEKVETKESKNENSSSSDNKKSSNRKKSSSESSSSSDDESHGNNHKGRCNDRHSNHERYEKSSKRDRYTSSRERDRHYKDRHRSSDRNDYHRRSDRDRRSREPDSRKRDRDHSRERNKRHQSAERTKHKRSKSPVHKKRHRSRSRTPTKREKDSKNDIESESKSKSPDKNPDVGPKPAQEDKKDSFSKRTDKDKALSARERYLARKAAEKAKPIAEPDSD
ncbi:uncharacterized protein LOC120329550 [Styela clava]